MSGGRAPADASEGKIAPGSSTTPWNNPEAAPFKGLEVEDQSRPGCPGEKPSTSAVVSSVSPE